MLMQMLVNMMSLTRKAKIQEILYYILLHESNKY